MIEFIIKNKEWIFSGVGVAVIAALYYIVKYIFIKKSTRDILDTEDNKNYQVPDNYHPISLRNALEEISSQHTTDLQKDGFAKNLVGKTVRWKGKVHSISPIIKNDKEIGYFLIIYNRDRTGLRTITNIELEDSQRDIVRLIKPKMEVEVEGIVEFETLGKFPRLITKPSIII